MKTKVCFKCGVDKPLSEYYKHKKMGDGHLNKCKDCTRKDVREREERLLKDPEWVEKEKARAREKYHRLYSDGRHRPSSEKKRETIMQYRSLYPEKYKAKSASKRVKRPKNTERHHWSYNEEHWKDLIFLSNKDHNFLHRHMTYDQERFMYRVALPTQSFQENELLDSKYRHIKFFLECKNEYDA